METISVNKVFGGELKKLQFNSQALGGLSTNTNVYLPPHASQSPVLYYLSGLTCTEDNA